MDSLLEKDTANITSHTSAQTANSMPFHHHDIARSSAPSPPQAQLSALPPTSVAVPEPLYPSPTNPSSPVHFSPTTRSSDSTSPPRASTLAPLTHSGKTASALFTAVQRDMSHS